MDEATEAQLRRILAKLWGDIEEGFDEIPRELFWWRLSQASKQVDSSKKFYLPVPTKNRVEWIKAMNILDRFGVLSFSLVDGDYLVQPTNLDELKDELFYTVSNFRMQKFIDFCHRFKYDLRKPLLGTHTAQLNINHDNVPIIIVDGNKRYCLPPLNKSTLVDMLKVALQPSLRKQYLTRNMLNAEAAKEDVKNELSLTKFPIGGKRLRKYRCELTIPEVLDEFYILNDAAIMGRGRVEIDDEALNEIKKLAQNSNDISTKRKKQ